MTINYVHCYENLFILFILSMKCYAYEPVGGGVLGGPVTGGRVVEEEPQIWASIK